MSYHPLDDDRPQPATNSACLLAVDLGLRAGLAEFGRDGRLQRYRSTNFGTIGRLKRAVSGVIPGPATSLFTEGDTRLARIWEQAAVKRGLSTARVAPHEWRARLYSESAMRRGGDWKAMADRQARAIIEWSSAPRPTSLRHDAAEAICIGLHGVLMLGWLAELPEAVRVVR